MLPDDDLILRAFEAALDKYAKFNSPAADAGDGTSAAAMPSTASSQTHQLPKSTVATLDKQPTLESTSISPRLPPPPPVPSPTPAASSTKRSQTEGTTVRATDTKLPDSAPSTSSAVPLKPQETSASSSMPARISQQKERLQEFVSQQLHKRWSAEHQHGQEQTHTYQQQQSQSQKPHKMLPQLPPGWPPRAMCRRPDLRQSAHYLPQTTALDRNHDGRPQPRPGLLSQAQYPEDLLYASTQHPHNSHAANCYEAFYPFGWGSLTLYPPLPPPRPPYWDGVDLVSKVPSSPPYSAAAPSSTFAVPSSQGLKGPIQDCEIDSAQSWDRAAPATAHPVRKESVGSCSMPAVIYPPLLRRKKGKVPPLPPPPPPPLPPFLLPYVGYDAAPLKCQPICFPGCSFSSY